MFRRRNNLGAGGPRSARLPSPDGTRTLIVKEYFGSRDELFARLGRTLCAPARVLADPVLSHFTAGSSS